ncbi:prophage tail fiber N-terminal domain-containing protein [Erwinia sp. 9145]|uniref:prophage tail fiber N-terminal domain-containing protein n=1 Tax=Erwinia sp. 9145 TaxID=1500895 RepID=UPI00054FF6EA|nr:prophage tail fiber N-terminal domain-containing protein [Erwinia sp. 9145]
MSLTEISGIFKSPDGLPLSSVSITITSTRLTSHSFANINLSQVTDDGGNYAFSLAPGSYKVIVKMPGDKSSLIIGRMEIEEGSETGTLNDYIQFAAPELATPTIYSEIKVWYESTRNISSGIEDKISIATGAVQQSAENAAAAAQAEETTASHSGIAADAAAQSEANRQAAELARNEAVSARDVAQSAAATSGMVKDIAAGLAATINGQSFSVAQGADSDIAIRTYLNNNGMAQETSRITGQAAVERISARVAPGAQEAIQFRAANGVIGQFRNDATLEIISLESGDVKTPLVQSAQVNATGIRSNLLTLGTGTTAKEGLLPFALFGKNGPVLAYYNDALHCVAADFTEIRLGGVDITTLFNQHDPEPVYPIEPPGILDGYEHIPYYGQSQVIGTTNGVIHNVPFDPDTLMPAGGLRAFGVTGYNTAVTQAIFYTSLVPIADRYGETFIPGQAIQARKLLTRDNPDRTVRPVFTVAGQGGADISLLKKGTTSYSQFVTQWAGVINAITALGEQYRCHTLNWCQGGSDDGLATPAAVWQTQVEKLRADLNADILAATGQHVDPAWIVIQINNYMRYPALNGKPNIGLKQYDLAVNADGYFGACPTYILDFIDVAHWTKESQVKVGAYIERVHRNILIEGGTWKPLHPISVITRGKFSLVKFHLPQGGKLELDTTIVSQATSYGFSAAQADGTAIPVNRVRLVSADTVELHFDATPLAGAVVMYGQTGQVGDPNAADGSGLGRINGMRGNLRDDAGYNDTISINGADYPLHNWCWMFNQPMEF